VAALDGIINQFEDWEKNLKRTFDTLGRPMEVKADLQMQGKPNTVDLENWLADFAVVFMAEYFVEEVFRPAFFQGTGVAGGGQASNPHAHMPKIEWGYSKIYDEIGYQRESTRGPHKWGKQRYRGLQRALERLDEIDQTADPDGYAEQWKKVQDLQAKQSAFEARERKAEHARSINEETASNTELDVRDFVANWDEGFKSLFTAMRRTSTPKRDAHSITVSMGPRQAVMSQTLARYSVTQGIASQSDHDSFFYAAEFGTGVAENVGGPQWVRQVKKNNAQVMPNSRFKADPGSWFFGGKTGGGMFSGQRGLHTLFEPGSREAQPVYRQWVEANLKPRLGAFLGQRSGGRITARA
jgi:hypothetical protein